MVFKFQMFNVSEDFGSKLNATIFPCIYTMKK